MLTELKRAAIERLLEKLPYFLVVVDPLQQNVLLPDHLRATEKPVGLHIGTGMAIPIRDLVVDERGIRGTLSFNGSPFFCDLPWFSIIQVSLAEGHVLWISSGSEPAEGEEAKQPAGKKRPHLRAV